MHPFNLTALVTLLALLLYIMMLLRTGGARQKSGIEAPAVTGDPGFERNYRVQMNTLESMPLFLGALWIFTLYWGELVAASLGVVWIIGRTIYMLSYVKDPKSRSLGFGIQGLATVVLLVGAIAGAIRALIATGGT